MIKLAHVHEIETVSLNDDVKNIALKTLEILDEAYGEARDPVADMGGFVAIVEEVNDLEKLKAYHLDVLADVPEYVDYIVTSKGEWLVALFLLSSDYSITVMMPKALAPAELLGGSELLLDALELYSI